MRVERGLIEAVEVGGQFISPIVIDLEFTINWRDETIKVSGGVQTRHPKINALITQTHDLSAAQSKIMFDQFMEHFSLPETQQVPKKRYTSADILITEKIYVPIHKILPHVGTDYVEYYVRLYKVNREVKRIFDEQSDADIYRQSIGIMGYPDNFRYFDDLIQAAGAQFLTADQKILLRMMIAQNGDFNPAYGFTVLFVHLLNENRIALIPQRIKYSPMEAESPLCKRGTLIVNQELGECHIIYREYYKGMLLQDTDTTIEFDHPVIQFVMVINVTAAFSCIIEKTYFILAPELRDKLKEHNLDKFISNTLEQLQRNYDQNLQILGMKTFHTHDDVTIVRPVLAYQERPAVESES